MRKLIIIREINLISLDEIAVFWSIQNDECKDICNHSNVFDTMDAVELYDSVARESILNGVNDYFGSVVYELENDPIKDEAERYVQRQLDGVNAVNSLMSELRLNSIVNNYPRVVNKTIEDSFKKVTHNILIGWWVSAKEECEVVQVNDFVTQALKDRIMNTIVAYIEVNY